jgi:hypothetical protein
MVVERAVRPTPMRCAAREKPDPTRFLCDMTADACVPDALGMVAALSFAITFLSRRTVETARTSRGEKRRDHRNPDRQ